MATMVAPSDSTPISRLRGVEPTASRTPNSRVRALTEKASTPETPTTAMSSAMPANPEIDERVQPLGRQDLGADVLERGRALDRLVRRQLADDARHRRHQRVRIARGRARTCASASPSLGTGCRAPWPARCRRARRPRRRRRRRCATASGCGCPTGSSAAVTQRLRLSASPLGKSRWATALADDDDPLLAGAIVLGELAAGDHWDAERREESRPHAPLPRVRIVLAVRRRVALDGELDVGPAAAVAPRHEEAPDHAVDARQLSDSLRSLLDRGPGPEVAGVGTGARGSPTWRRSVGAGRGGGAAPSEIGGMSKASTCRVRKPVFAVCRAMSAATSMPAPASSTNEKAICVVANARSRRLVPGVIRRLPLAMPKPAAASDDGSRGT